LQSLLELKYCPYRSLVEDFPIGDTEAAKAEELGGYAKLVKERAGCRATKKMRVRFQTLIG